MTAEILLAEFVKQDFTTVLDIGSGDGGHAKVLRSAGKHVTTIDNNHNADINADYLNHGFDQFDAIWCAHVLEHQRNVGLFLDKINADLKEGGWLGITVPPLKHEIVGGHVSLWNMGLLLYNLILSGLDCSKAKTYQYGYNLSVLVRKKSINLPQLRFANGDIEKLSRYFPFDAKQGFDGSKV